MYELEDEGKRNFPDESIRCGTVAIKLDSRYDLRSEHVSP